MSLYITKLPWQTTSISERHIDKLRNVQLQLTIYALFYFHAHLQMSHNTLLLIRHPRQRQIHAIPRPNALIHRHHTARDHCPPH